MTYEQWKAERVETTVSGVAVFKGTLLGVVDLGRYVCGLYGPSAMILRYPQLTLEDIMFAGAFAHAEEAAKEGT